MRQCESRNSLINESEVLLKVFRLYLEVLQDLYHFRGFIFESVRSDVRLRYRGSFIGILWSVLNPTLQALIIFFVFREIFKIRTLGASDYFSYVYSGVLLVGFFLTTTLQAGEQIFQNNNLVRNTKLPVTVFIAISILTNSVNFLFGLLPLLVYIILIGTGISITLLMLPIVLAISWFWIFFVGVILNGVYSKFLDLRYLVPILLGLSFYLTPIYYSEDMLSSDIAKWVIAMNPLTVFLSNFRFTLGIVEANFNFYSIFLAISVVLFWPLVPILSRRFREKAWEIQ